MKIGGAATASGSHVETIRYYERIGLLPVPPRTDGGYRDYSPAQVDRLRFIARGRALGFSLDEIRSLLRLAEAAELSCEEVDELARHHLAEIEQRIGELRRMAQALRRTIDSSQHGVRGECAILDALRVPGRPPPRRRVPEVHGQEGAWQTT
ncbi:MAG: helix-turn-helix domain-containing protein [Lysobacteraceae bacterium]|jgi:MerR family mercuric resistance operon transcriptional regulator